MTKLHIPSSIDTSNPVGDVVMRRQGRDHRHLVVTLVARIRQLVERSRHVHVNSS